MRFLILFGLLFLALNPTSFAKGSNYYKDKRIQIELVSAQDIISKGDTAIFAIRVTLSKGWHIYWVNPGDAGEPTILEISTNIDPKQKFVPLFPTPSYKNTEGIVTLEYKGTVYFPFQIFIPHTFQSDSLAFNIYSKWLVCREKCVPGEAKLSLSLPLGKEIPKRYVDTKVHDIFKQYPKDTLNSKIEFSEDFANLIVDANFNNAINSVIIYPITEGLFNLEQKLEFRADDKFLKIKLPMLQYVWGDKSKVEGLLEIEFSNKKKKYFWLNVVK
ncbi:MAG: hypothetical protein CH6_0567 [Candidatus Kapaibacterium sp.]|nr:MAG: hypothetical protein CH6_0567 [Candidatus Kapabacteria bacterium]